MKEFLVVFGFVIIGITLVVFSQDKTMPEVENVGKKVNSEISEIYQDPGRTSVTP